MSINLLDSAEETRRAALRSFLRSRRARLTPAGAGLPEVARRRARGLRREDVAEIAGVSLGWYARFELGQLANVSERLIESVAATLRLDPAETAYLRALARPLPAPSEPGDDRIPETLRFVVESFTAGPATILDARLDTLVVNDVARRLEPAFNVPGARANLAWLAFVEPAFPQRFVDTDRRRRDIVAMLRYSYAHHVGERDFDDLIATISEQSAEFVDAWNTFEVRPIQFEELEFRIGDETMAFSTIVLSAGEAPGKLAVFLKPSDPKRFGELLALLP